MTFEEFRKRQLELIEQLSPCFRKTAQPKRRAFIAFYFPKDTCMGTQLGPNLPAGKTLGFILRGAIAAGMTFAEPTVKLATDSVAQGALVLQPSVTDPSDGSAPVTPVPDGYVGNFHAAGTFKSDGSLGVYDIEADVMGVDDANATGQVVAPTFEPVAFDESAFTIS